jgi:SAM-dependent methyltransferase
MARQNAPASPTPPNAFSKTWRGLFLTDVPAEHTRVELDFVRRQLPLAEYPHLLDVACGVGRHARLLAEAGYGVLGVDRSPELILEAGRGEHRATFQVLDMRDLGRLSGSFDGVLSLWHSFGFHDAATNRAILEAFRERLRAHGRVILDVYNREHASARPLIEQAHRSGVTIETRRTWLGPRLKLELFYDGALGDRFDWHLYSPAELSALCKEVGLDVVLTCAWFNPAVPASPEHARMQLVVERR